MRRRAELLGKALGQGSSETKAAVKFAKEIDELAAALAKVRQNWMTRLHSRQGGCRVCCAGGEEALSASAEHLSISRALRCVRAF